MDEIEYLHWELTIPVRGLTFEILNGSNLPVEVRLVDGSLLLLCLFEPYVLNSVERKTQELLVDER